MGLFDFAKDLGKKLFGSGDDPAQKIEQNIAAANPGVDDLGVTFKDGVVHLSGKAASAEAMEKAVLMAGNVKGVTEVKIDGMEAPEPEPEVQYYTIVSGDSLSKIAKAHYDFLGSREVRALGQGFEASLDTYGEDGHVGFQR